MAVAAASAMTGQAVDGATAVTGEVSVRGEVRPVGGVPSKVEAALRASLKRVIVPRENYLQRFQGHGIEVIPIDKLEEAVEMMLVGGKRSQPAPREIQFTERLVAQGAD